MEDEEEEEIQSSKKIKKNSGYSQSKRNNLKNPEVDTSFLPDRDREEADRLAREELRQEWLRDQEKMKLEAIEVTYSYWDGSGHRNTVTVSETVIKNESLC
jgi:protein FAM50